jgi:hypothetical protein
VILPLGLMYGMTYQRIKNLENRVSQMASVDERLAVMETKIDFIFKNIKTSTL